MCPEQTVTYVSERSFSSLVHVRYPKAPRRKGGFGSPWHDTAPTRGG